MDNCFTGRCRASEKDVLCFYWLVGHVLCICLGAYRTSFLSRQCDVIASFSLSKSIKTPSKLTAGPVGRALSVHWIGYSLIEI